ncbi:UNVERIFIED_CONTAM: Zinc finger BED domain-containing protein RICESLEEPER 2 [Sesamum latifolium]|uniref:Zinc finger BED domain-containing protein RICESLEEPER 2 n=1 Tax=Sesamum latifolium TaxID=2727402 RepID=A0AAW2TN21_9LAMI
MEGEMRSDDEMRLAGEGISNTLPPEEESQSHSAPKRKETCKRSKVWTTLLLTLMARESLELNTISSFCQSMDIKESCSHMKFDQEALRQGLTRMIIMDELPFKFVENEEFWQFMSLALPHFMIPSRTTVTRDCYKLFFDEKKKLMNYFKSSGQRISLTTDTWTSNQRLTYMCLTVHYIDSDWKMHKVILNFIPCPTHRGDDVGLLIETCLLDWGIDKIFAITVDNASSNDTTVAYLRRRYVRQSPARTRKFNDYVLEEKIECKKSLCLDVPTRWNSVYMMLETALIFQGVFERCEIYDADFRNDFMPGGPYGRIGLPLTDDWVMVSKFMKVLRYFYDLTNQISESLYVTSNTFLDEISDVDDLLKEWLKGDDVYLVDMARQMKAKFDKYLENIEKMNMMLYVVVMLDPRHKYSYLRYVFKNMHGPEIGQKMGDLAKSALYDVFEEYKKCILLHHHALLPLHPLNQVRNKLMILNEGQLETREKNGNKWCLRLEVGIGQNWILI